MRGWCLRRPRITRLGMRHVLHTDALSVGLQLYEARQGRRVAVVKRRKRHMDQWQHQCGDTMRFKPARTELCAIASGQEWS